MPMMESERVSPRSRLPSSSPRSARMVSRTPVTLPRFQTVLPPSSSQGDL